MLQLRRPVEPHGRHQHSRGTMQGAGGAPSGPGQPGALLTHSSYQRSLQARLCGKRRRGWATWLASTTLGVCRQHSTCGRKEEEQLRRCTCLNNGVHCTVAVLPGPVSGSNCLCARCVCRSCMYVHKNFSRRLTARDPCQCCCALKSTYFVNQIARHCLHVVHYCLV